MHYWGMTPQLVLCTTSEIASRYRLDDSTVRRWVAKGLLKPAATTPGGHYRFDPADVEALLNVKPETVSAA